MVDTEHLMMEQVTVSPEFPTVNLVLLATQNKKASNTQNHFLKMEHVIFKTDWGGCNFPVRLLLPFLSEPTFTVSLGFPYGS